ncbi:DUF2691 family protein [Ectobacillus sp. JY-23]|nr:DUF2691 family protein [Ectobacillus sp. JY-23]UOY92316.1 DUF2691 family protein [Ectobacillus sp. JY-23]
MKRGIRFEIPHEFGNLLWEIVMPFGVTAFVWASVLFSRGGASFLKSGNRDGWLISEKKISINLQAYPTH